MPKHCVSSNNTGWCLAELGLLKKHKGRATPEGEALVKEFRQTPPEMILAWYEADEAAQQAMATAAQKANAAQSAAKWARMTPEERNEYETQAAAEERRVAKLEGND